MQYFLFFVLQQQQLNNHDTSTSSQQAPPSHDNSRDSRNLPNSRLSTASRTSQSSRRSGTPHSPPDSFTRDMSDPEAQKLRVAYERVHSLRMDKDKGGFSPLARDVRLGSNGTNLGLFTISFQYILALRVKCTEN